MKNGNVFPFKGFIKEILDSLIVTVLSVSFISIKRLIIKSEASRITFKNLYLLYYTYPLTTIVANTL